MRQSIFKKDLDNKQMHISRTFDASRNLVWEAWTEPTLIDQWWAPKPWKAKTKSQDFRPGGEWIYCMIGPEGENHWAKAKFIEIDAPKMYIGTDAFCDEDGNENTDMPNMHWKVNFEDQGESTVVNITITFDSIDSLETIISMGFQEGFTAAHGNLDELLKIEKAQLN